MMLLQRVLGMGAPVGFTGQGVAKSRSAALGALAFAEPRLLAGNSRDTFEPRFRGTPNTPDRAPGTTLPTYLLKLGKLDWKNVEPGIRHVSLQPQYGRGPLLVNALEIDLNRGDLSVRPVLAGHNTFGQMADLQEMARLTGMVAGVNGGFFRIFGQHQDIPLGVVMLNGQLLSGPLNQRAVLAIGAGNKIYMDRLSLQGTLTSGQRKITVHNQNQLPKVRNVRTGQGEPWTETIVYTPTWGQTPPAIELGLRQIQVKDGHVVAVSGKQTLNIPPGGYVIVGPDEELKDLQAGEPVDLSLKLQPHHPDVKHALAAGPLLLKDGKVMFHNQGEEGFGSSGEKLFDYAPRTAVGLTADNKLLLVTIDGRQPGVSIGVSMEEVITIMKQLGAKDAMNFDGGGSTQMLLQGNIVNTPCETNPLREVPTAIGIFRK